MTKKLKDFIQVEIPDNQKEVKNEVGYTLNGVEVSEDEFIAGINTASTLAFDQTKIELQRLISLEKVNSLLKESISIFTDGTIEVVPQQEVSLENFKKGAPIRDALMNQIEHDINRSAVIAKELDSTHDEEDGSGFKFVLNQNKYGTLKIVKGSLYIFNKGLDNIISGYRKGFKKNTEKLESLSKIIKERVLEGDGNNRRLKGDFEPLVLTYGLTSERDKACSLKEYPERLKDSLDHLEQLVQLTNLLNISVLPTLHKEIVFVGDTIDKAYSADSYRKLIYDILIRLNVVSRNLKYDVFKYPLKGSSTIKREIETSVKEDTKVNYYYYGSNFEDCEKDSIFNTRFYLLSTTDFQTSDFQPILDGVGISEIYQLLNDFMKSWEICFHDGVSELIKSPFKIKLSGRFKDQKETMSELSECYERFCSLVLESEKTLEDIDKGFKKLNRTIKDMGPRNTNHETGEVKGLVQVLRTLLKYLVLKYTDIVTHLTRHFNSSLLKTIMRENNNVSSILSQ